MTIELSSGFDVLIGNTSLKEDLNYTFNNDKQSHAYLIEGVPGSGKKTLAKILSKAFLCGESQKPCGKCNHCIKAEKNIHPDIYFITPPENKEIIPVDSIRELKTEAYILPNEAAKKIYIIQNADNLTPQAQNAFLKLLEEPPQHTVFILLCENTKLVFQTIMSRVVHLTLSPVTFEESGAYFKDNFKIDDEKIKNVLNAANGYIGAAIKLIKSGVDEKQKKMCKDFLNNLLENSEYNFIMYINKLGTSKENLISFLNTLILCLRDITNFKLTGNNYSAVFDNEETQKFSKVFATKKILNLIDIVSNTKMSLENTYVNKTICINSMFTKCWEEVH